MKRPVLLGCFFLSGAAGLVYEVVWIRTLGLTFGHTVWAYTTVLAVFMGGLAFGSVVVGKIADRSRDPARLYAVLELSLGVYCLFCPFFLELSRHGHRLVVPRLGDVLLARTVLQFLLAGLVLVVPTALMGGTVPAMARATIADPAEAGRRFGLLYGVNTVGAAIGAFAAGYWLLPAIGMAAANAVAAAVNIAIGAGLLVAGGAARRTGEAGQGPPDAPAPAANRSQAPVSAPILQGAFAVTGAAAMIFQIAWVRSLVPIIGSSTYAYSAILVTFLLGIAVGSGAFSRIRTSTPALSAALLAGIALSVLLVLPFFDVLPGLLLRLFRGFSGNDASFRIVQFIIVFLVILVPATLMGMVFPSLSGLAVRDGGRVGADVGRLYGFNTAGAILGSILAGFVLVPGIGAQKTLCAGIVLELLAAGAFLFHFRPSRRALAVPACAVLGLAAFFVPSWDEATMNQGVYYSPWNYEGPDDFASQSAARAGLLLYSREGISSNVAVFGRMDGERWFTVNGKPDGSSTSDMETQVKIAMFPMIIRGDARRVAVLGLGTGVTAATAGLFEQVEAIDIVELEPQVAVAASFFERENGGILSDPRTRLHIDDGRSFFETRKAAYDVVLSEPSNPWIAGVANLYTAEAFRSVRDSLAPGGVFGLWVPSYDLSPELFRLIARTFLHVFPEATLWQTRRLDVLLVGRNGAEATTDSASLRRRLEANPGLREAFGLKGEFPLDPMLTAFLLGPREMRVLAGPGDINTDDRNILEFLGPQARYRDDHDAVLREIVGRKESSVPPFLVAPETADAAFHLRAGRHHLAHGEPILAAWEFARLPSLAPPQARGAGAAGRIPENGLREDFEGPTRLRFVPAAGACRPDGGESTRFDAWRGTVAQLTRTSGVVKGAGAGGGGALVVRGIRGTPVGYLATLEVEPAAEYELACRLRVDGDAAGAGIAVSEYDSRDDDGAQPGAAFGKRHLVHASVPLRRQGGRGYRDGSFRFRAGGNTVAVRLFFFLEGGAGDSAAFDDVAVRRIR